MIRLPVPGLVVLIALAAGPGAVAAQDDQGIARGAPAPAVRVPDLDGREVDLGRLLGRQPVFIQFWATWCSVCEELMPRVRAARARYGDQVAFYGINVAVNQTRERVRRHMARQELPFEVLYDDRGVSQRAFAAPQTSYIVIIDRAGRIAYTGVGADQPFEAALQRVTAKDSTSR